MNKDRQKLNQKGRRAHRTRARMSGTAERPRLCVNRSLRRIAAQLINDDTSQTLAFADDRELKGTKIEVATEVGKRIAEAAKSKGIEAVIFDRGAFKYHGRVKALAEGAREAGLKF
ncbi:MAG: 50S ribosomal protein L18 [Candidatus Kerfeldbacteria bacterium]